MYVCKKSQGPRCDFKVVVTSRAGRLHAKWLSREHTHSITEPGFTDEAAYAKHISGCNFANLAEFEAALDKVTKARLFQLSVIFKGKRFWLWRNTVM